MKVLFIANSFGEDATRYIEPISEGTLYVRNLHIGGCSLETHAKNIESGVAAYEYQKDAVKIEMSSVKDALLREDWDVVSVQQVSNLSGAIDSYEPYLGKVIDFVKELRPNAKIVFHRTWAYDDASTHPCFGEYNNDRAYMYEKISEAVAAVEKRYALPVIPSGVAVERARELPEVKDGTYKMTRDTFHLSLDHGRYLAGLVLYRFLTGKSAKDVKFLPEGANADFAEKLKAIADEVV